MTKEQTKPMKLSRIIDPCNRVIALKEFGTDASAYAWLLRIQKQRKDPFLELQTKVGRSWVTLAPPQKKGGKPARG